MRRADTRRQRSGRKGAERRWTDQVVNAWRTAPARQKLLQRLIGSPLWEHCFLIIPDQAFPCSAVIEYGASAGSALGLVSGRVNSMARVPRYLLGPLNSLCQQCLYDGEARHYDGQVVSPDNRVIHKYRLAAMPIPSPIGMTGNATTETVYVLGVITFTSVH